MAESSAPPEPNQLPDQDPSPLVRPAAVLRWLKEGHERFLDGHSIHPHTTRERMRAVVEGQHPLAAVLGCADSRVPVELLFDSGFGDLFVVRNAGTMSTTAAIASLEYAVGHLDVSLVVVLGHEACGAVSAALNPKLLLTPSISGGGPAAHGAVAVWRAPLPGRILPAPHTQRRRQSGALQRAAD